LLAAEPGLLRAEPRLSLAERGLPRPQGRLLRAERLLRLEDKLGFAKDGGVSNDVGGGALTNVEQSLLAGAQRARAAHVVHRSAHRAAPAPGRQQDVGDSVGGLDGARSDGGWLDQHDAAQDCGGQSKSEATTALRGCGERLGHSSSFPNGR
jgi:hypothetical protein